MPTIVVDAAPRPFEAGLMERSTAAGVKHDGRESSAVAEITTGEQDAVLGAARTARSTMKKNWKRGNIAAAR